MKNTETSKTGMLRFKGAFLCPFVILLLAAGCATTLRMDSLWKKDEVVVNGKSDDWRGALYYFEDSEFSLGLRNDAEYLYVCLSAESQMMRTQILARGLTVWFDPAGKTEKVFGIRFPMGRQADAGPRQPLNEEERAEMMDRRQEMDPAVQERRLQSMIREAVLIGPEKDASNQIPVEDLQGIVLHIDLSGGWMVYEMKVPLIRTENLRYAVGAVPGRPLGIGIEIPKMNRSAKRRPMPGGMGGRGGMGGGGMGGLGGRGGMPGQQPVMMNGLKLWLKVQLAGPSGIGL